MFINIEGKPFNINYIEAIAIGKGSKQHADSPLNIPLVVYLTSGAEIPVFYSTSAAELLEKQAAIANRLTEIPLEFFR